jgi:hypothetical protein
VAATDDYANWETPPYGPCRHAAAVTPSDSVDLSNVSRFLFVGTTGSGGLVVVMEDGVVATFAGLVGGTLLPLAVSRVKSTGTTVSNVISMW